VLTDWDSDTDPGDVDNALDQLAERVDDIENGVGATADIERLATTTSLSTASGTVTELIKITLTSAPAGIYILNLRVYLSYQNPGKCVIQYSSDDSTYTSIDGSGLPTHAVGGGDFRTHFNYYTHTGGTIYFRAAHVSEGSRVDYGYSNDPRWGVWLMAHRIN
jgi:hypothetical protein